MENLKILRGLLACIAILDSTSSNIPMPPERTTGTTRILSSTVSSGACRDSKACTRYKDLHRRCSGTDGWYRQHCRLSCNMCITDQVSVTREISPTSTTSPVTANQVIVQEHDDVSLASSETRHMTASKRVASVTVSSGACKDDKACTGFKDFHRLCSGTDVWFRHHCRLSCNMCITDQVSVTRYISHTSTISSVRSTNVSVQVHDDVTLAPSHPQTTVVTTWIPSPAAASGTCKDGNMCTRFKDLPRLCSGNNGRWFRQHCRLSCNMCITDQVSVTRDISHTSTISPVRSTNVSVQVHDDVTLATSHPQTTVVTTWIPSPAEFSHPKRVEVTTWIPSPAGDGQNMEWVMNNIAVTVLTPILVILVIVIIVITKIKVSGRKVVLTPPREQSKVVVTYSGLTPQPEKQAYTAIDLEAHTYSSVDDIRHETEDYQNINDRGSQHIGKNQDQCTSDSRTLDCTLYEN